LLWFANKHGGACCSSGACAPCELLDRLTDAFDDLIGLPCITGEEVFSQVFSPNCEGLDTSPPPAEAHEVNAFIG
jgi:hypothetical protein